jgi:hypothetical protein
VWLNIRSCTVRSCSCSSTLADSALKACRHRLLVQLCIQGAQRAFTWFPGSV